MAILKIESLRLGPGLMTTNVGESQVWVGTSNPVDGAPGVGTGKDGDLFIKVAGANSDIYIKASDTWTSLAGKPVIVSLTDGQVAPAVAFQYSAAAYPYAQINYTVRRGSGHGRKRFGNIVVLNDSISVVEHSEESSEIGTDVNVEFSYQISGGMVQVLYTSVLEGVSITLNYDVRGWI